MARRAHSPPQSLCADFVTGGLLGTTSNRRRDKIPVAICCHSRTNDPQTRRPRSSRWACTGMGCRPCRGPSCWKGGESCSGRWAATARQAGAQHRPQRLARRAWIFGPQPFFGPFLAPILDPGFGAGDQTLLSGRAAEDGPGPSPGPIGHRDGAAFAGWDHPGQGGQRVQPTASASSTSISSSTSAAWS